MATITESIELIDPRKAQEYLDTKGPPIRPVDTKLVTRLANDMAGGRWLTVRHGSPVEPIRLTLDSKLVSGRLRMMAVIEAGVAIEFIVQRADWDKVRPCPKVSPGELRAASELLAEFCGSSPYEMADGEPVDLQGIAATVMRGAEALETASTLLSFSERGTHNLMLQFAYFTECTLATVEWLESKKRPPVYELARQRRMADQMVEALFSAGLDSSQMGLRHTGLTKRIRELEARRREARVNP
jgi:hypothetical protein